MVSPNQNSAPSTPELPFGENLTGLPDDMANNPEVIAAVQRAIARANQDFEHPELHQLPMPRPIQPEVTITQPTRAVIGSRANNSSVGAALAPPAPSASQNPWDNPQGRSSAAIQHQREGDAAVLKRQGQTGR